MKEITCPKCGTVITIDDATFSEILSQVKMDVVNEEVEFILQCPAGACRKQVNILFKCRCRYLNCQKFVTFLSHEIKIV